MAESLQHNQPEYSVSEISARVRRVVEDNFGYVRVRGEISECKIQAGSGHCYLTLKDENAALSAVCWKGALSKLRHRPQAGMEVIATGKLTTYAKGKSAYQLVIEALEPAGIGALMAMLEQRKKQLASEGLFDAARKKPLPFLPEVIGIVTSPTGAVIRDMLHRLRERFPRHVLLWPVAVQGQDAAAQVAAAIAGFNILRDGGAPPRPDLLIVARGGGSIEDLWAFNEETVARAVAASAIPIISAVGHETDTTLIDYVADRRAPTPTGAAEFAVPVRDELRSAVEMAAARMNGAMRTQLGHQRERVVALARGLPRPQQLVATMAQSLDDTGERLAQAMQRRLARHEEKVWARARSIPRPHQYVAVMEKSTATLAQRLDGAMRRHLQQRHEHSAALARQLSPRFLLMQADRREEEVRRLAERARQGALRRLERADGRMERLAAMLASLNMLAVLKRGFAVVKDATGRVIPAAAAIAEGQAVTLQFHDGRRGAIIAAEGAAPTARARKPRAKNLSPRQASPRQAGLFDD